MNDGTNEERLGMKAQTSIAHSTRTADFADLRTLVRQHPAPKKLPSLYDRQAVLQVLEAAQAEIASPDRWLKGAYAETDDGWPIREEAYLYDYPRESIAKMCSDGAVRLARHSLNQPWRIVSDVLQVLDACAGEEVSQFNDRPACQHSDVMSLFETARALVKAAA